MGRFLIVLGRLGRSFGGLGGSLGVSGGSLGGLGRSWGASGDLREPQEAPKYIVLKKLMIWGSLLGAILGYKVVFFHVCF